MSTFGTTLLVDLGFLIEHKLTFENWFLLHCLGQGKNDELLKYTGNCKKFSKLEVLELETRGLLTLKIRDDFSLTSMRITPKGKDLVLKDTIVQEKDFIQLFQQLKDTYPKTVPAENGSLRRLHGDLSRCKRLYQKLIINDYGLDKELHNKILGAITREVQERTKGRNLPFMQNLVTYLHQQNYLLYFDVEASIEKEKGDDI